MNNGQAWAQATRHNQPESQYLDQLEQFASTQQALEREAEAFFADLQHVTAPAAMSQAEKLGRTTVGFYASSWHLNTAAFVIFRQWVANEGLSCMCAQLAPEQREAPDQDIVINLFPAQH